MEEILNTEIVVVEPVVEEDDGFVTAPEVFDPIECDDISQGDIEEEAAELVETLVINPVDCNIYE